MLTEIMAEQSISKAVGHLYQMEKEECSKTNAETFSKLSRALKELDQIENFVKEAIFEVT